MIFTIDMCGGRILLPTTKEDYEKCDAYKSQLLPAEAYFICPDGHTFAYQPTNQMRKLYSLDKFSSHVRKIPSLKE